MHQLIAKSIYSNLKGTCKSHVLVDSWFANCTNLSMGSCSLVETGMQFYTRLTENGFVQNPADNCAYNKEKDGDKVMLIVWDDDLIIAASNHNVLNNVKAMLTERFEMKGLGKLNIFWK